MTTPGRVRVRVGARRARPILVPDQPAGSTASAPSREFSTVPRHHIRPSATVAFPVVPPPTAGNGAASTEISSIFVA